MAVLPTSEYEKSLFERGFSVVAGADEAGRGPLAGPIVGAAVAVEVNDLPFLEQVGARDSKKLSEKKREAIYEQLMSYFGTKIAVHIVSAEEIDLYGIQPANMAVLTRPLEMIAPSVSYGLIDGFNTNSIRIPTEKIVRGDESVLVIAAASIIAKVTRDRYMREVASRFPQYGFDSHKGYGSAAHFEAIRAHGLTPEHRRTFIHL